MLGAVRARVGVATAFCDQHVHSPDGPRRCALPGFNARAHSSLARAHYIRAHSHLCTQASTPDLVRTYMRACTCLPPCAELVGFEPDFTIINACSVVNKKWQAHGLNSEVAVAFNIEKRLAVIFGTWCAVGRQAALLQHSDMAARRVRNGLHTATATAGNPGCARLDFGPLVAADRLAEGGSSAGRQG